MAFLDYRRAQAGLAGIFLALASATASADAGDVDAGESAELRIEAIRNALINRALQSEVRVRGMSWVDESGRLREHSLITSDLKVRGIRINAYLENDKPRESIVIDTVAAITSSRNCMPPEARLRRPALLSMDYQPKDAHSAQYQLAQIANAIEKQVEAEFSGNGIWQLQKQSQLSEYAQVVNFGQRQSAPYRITITVSESSGTQLDPNASMGMFHMIMGLPRPAHSPELALRISLTETGSNRILWNETTSLQLPLTAVQMQSRQPDKELKETISRVVTVWHSKIETLLKCEPVFFNLSTPVTGEYFINAGAAAGIRIHDKFLIVEKARFPANILGQELLQTIMLGEVQSVSRSSANIKIQGSLEATKVGRWVALPL